MGPTQQPTTLTPTTAVPTTASPSTAVPTTDVPTTVSPSLIPSDAPSGSLSESPTTEPTVFPTLEPTERCRNLGIICTAGKQCCSMRCRNNECAENRKNSASSASSAMDGANATMDGATKSAVGVSGAVFGLLILSGIGFLYYRKKNGADKLFGGINTHSRVQEGSCVALPEETDAVQNEQTEMETFVN